MTPEERAIEDLRAQCQAEGTLQVTITAGFALHLIERFESHKVEREVHKFASWLKGLDYTMTQHAIDTLRSVVCIHCGGEPRCHCWNDD